MGSTTAEKPAAISVQEYLSTNYRPDRDYIEGVLIERNGGEKDHSKLQTRLWLLLHRIGEHHPLHAFVELRVQVRPERFRVPDVCVVLGEEPDEQILTKPPFLCVEILAMSRA